MSADLSSGSPLNSISCPKCGASQQSLQQFCSNCGTQLASKPITTETYVRNNSAEQKSTQRRFPLALVLLGGTLVIVLLLLLFNFLSSQLPSDAKAAFDSYIGQQCQFEQCQPPKITQVQHVNLDEASRLNGIQDRYCIRYSQTKFSDVNGKWLEFNNLLATVKSKDTWYVGIAHGNDGCSI